MDNALAWELRRRGVAPVLSDPVVISGVSENDLRCVVPYLMPWRLIGPSAVTVSRRGFSDKMILTLVGWQ